MRFIATEPESAQIPRAMADFDLESDESVAQRAAALRETVKPDMNQRQFAAWLGITYQRWNNVENGGPLSRDLAMVLCRKIPTVTLEWLYRGRYQGMHSEFAQRLSEAEEKAKIG
jgi:DNA-binding XRE family transcriptional regulator